MKKLLLLLLLPLVVSRTILANDLIHDDLENLTTTINQLEEGCANTVIATMLLGEFIGIAMGHENYSHVDGSIVVGALAGGLVGGALGFLIALLNWENFIANVREMADKMEDSAKKTSILAMLNTKRFASLF